MKRFILKFILFTSPLIIILAMYVIQDPFMVIRNYDTYYKSDKPEYLQPNRDFASTELWMKYHKKNKYNSYILGNSRSGFFLIDTWHKKIKVPYSQCFHFDAAGESLYGIERKINFIDANNESISNVLIVMDYDVLIQTKNSTSHIKAKHPVLSGQNGLSFQMEFLRTYLDYRFLWDYIKHLFNIQQEESISAEDLHKGTTTVHDIITNEIRFDQYELVIQKTPEVYYTPRLSLFYKRDSIETASPAVIKKEQAELLTSIHNVFVKQNTRYKIVISPLYNQKRLNPADLKFLQSLFGSENIYDYSGINTITNNKYNYYETSHYRPTVATEIMNQIYSSDSLKTVK